MSGLTILPDQVEDDNIATVRNNIDGIIEKVALGGGSVENLEKLLNMKYEYDKREAQKSFHVAFSKMQNEFPPIPKTHEVTTNSGAKAYKYAALEDIIAICKPIMAKHGFSYSWSQDNSTNQNVTRITCTIYGHGHSESAYADVPIMEGTKLMNAAQIAGSQITYGKRYSFINITGVMCEDDVDGRVSIETKVAEAKANRANDSINGVPVKQYVSGLYKKYKEAGLPWSEAVEVKISALEVIAADEAMALAGDMMKEVNTFKAKK